MEKRSIDLIHLVFFYKQLVCKQLALAWQIVKQFSGLNPLSLSNNKNYRLNKNGVFLCNKHRIAVKPTLLQNSAVSKTFLRNFKITDYKCRF